MSVFVKLVRGNERRTPIPLFAEKPSHPSVPLDHSSAIARSRGQGRSQTGACALPLTEASPVASCRQYGGGPKALIAFLHIIGFCAVSTLPSGVRAETALIGHTVRHDGYATYIAEASHRFRMPKAWIRAVIHVESAGKKRVISSKGAMGLMQLMPDTWEELSARYQFGKDPFEPRNNILAGTAYLRELYDRYGSPGFLAAYNAGPQRYEDYLSKQRKLPSETRAYVAALSPFVGGGERPSPVIVAAAHLQNWNQSSVFVPRESQLETIVQVQSEARADAFTATSVRDVSAIVPLSNGLFVVRTNEPRQ
jgi:Transglycosylase SLT domain